jgi:hypothetical protein
VKTGRNIFSTSEDLTTPVAIFKGERASLVSSFHCSQLADAIICGLLPRLRQTFLGVCSLQWNISS